MGVLHAIGVTAVAKLNAVGSSGIWPGKIVSIALLVGVAAAWAAVDGWLLRRDRGRDWFVAGLITGPVAGVLGVVGRATLVDQTGVGALSDALTGGAAFTALLVIVPAGVGLFAGSRLLGTSRTSDADEEDEPPTPPAPRHRSRSTVTGRRRRRGTITARKRAAQPARPTPTPRARS